MTRNTAQSTAVGRVRPAKIKEPVSMVHPPAALRFTATTAVIVDIRADGKVMVALPGQPPVVALIATSSAVDLKRAYAESSPVVVLPMDGDLQRPVIIGIVQASLTKAPPLATATVDGRRVELTGQDEVILTCGKASITLTKAGKIIIKGTYVSSGSEGVHRITGGSVQIN